MRRVVSILAALALSVATVAAVSADAAGVGNIRDDAAMSDKITAVVSGFAALPSDQAYEGWLVTDDGGEKLSLGIWAMGASGGGTFVYTSPTGENLLGKYNKLVVTVEPVPDADPGPSAVVSAKDEIPLGPMAHIRHVQFAWPPTPGPVGLAVGQRSQAETASLHANLSNTAAQNGDLAGAQQHAEHVVNIIEGESGANYGDLDGDGATQNPGDTFGLLTYAAGTAQHANLAMNASDADVEVLLHGQHVVDSSTNVTTWATVARDNALKVAGTSDIANAQTYAAMMAQAAQDALEGVDANTSGAVDPIIGEGAAQTAYLHSQLMAQYNLADTGVATPSLPRTGGAEVPVVWITLGVALLAGALVITRVGRRMRV
jgi:hypothetical protein